jgi:hypothetical protein
MEFVNNLIAINPQEIPAHIKIGQDDYNNAKYDQAIIEFKSILKVAPDNIEARVWLKKARESIDKGDGTSAQKTAKVKELKERPGGQRLCLYCIKGDVSHRICSRLFQCKTCEFGQGMQDAQLARVSARRKDKSAQ